MLNIQELFIVSQREVVVTRKVYRVLLRLVEVKELRGSDIPAKFLLSEHQGSKNVPLTIWIQLGWGQIHGLNNSPNGARN